MRRKKTEKILSFVSAVLICVSAVSFPVPVMADEEDWAGRVVVPGDMVTGMDELYIGDDNYDSGSGEDISDNEWANETPWAYMTLPVEPLGNQNDGAGDHECSETEAETEPGEYEELTAYKLDKLGMVVELDKASFPEPVNEVIMPDADIEGEDGTTRTASFESAYFSKGDQVTIKADDAPEGMVFEAWNVFFVDPVDAEDEQEMSVTDLGLEEGSEKESVLSFVMPEEELILRLRPSYMEAPLETEAPVSDEAIENPEGTDAAGEDLKEFVPRSITQTCAPEGAGTSTVTLDGLMPEDQGSVKAVGGQNITVETAPGDGYKTMSITAVNTAGETVAASGEGETVFTFVMPDEDVSITTVFDINTEPDATPETEPAQAEETDTAPSEENVTTEEAQVPDENAQPAEATADVAEAEPVAEETGEEATDVSEAPSESGMPSEDAMEEDVDEEGEDFEEEDLEDEEQDQDDFDEEAPVQTEEQPADAGQAPEAEEGAEQAPEAQPSAPEAEPSAQEAEPSAQEAEPAIYKVSFDAMGGSDVMSQAVAEGGTAAQPEPPVRDGYSFEGWHTDETLSSAYDFSAPVNNNITLYAKWTQIQSEEEPAQAVDIADQEQEGTDLAEEKKSGHLVDPAVMDDDDDEDGDVNLDDDEDQNGQASTPKVFKVSFNSMGGSDVMSQAVTEGQKAVTPDNPVKTGFVFDGWFKEEGYKILYDFGTGVSSDITLYAKWKEENKADPEPAPQDAPDNAEETAFTVTFNSMGGSEVVAQTVKEGGTAVRPDNPTRDGFTFDTWYREESLENVYDFATPVESDLTLFAKWNQVPAVKTVTFNTNGGSAIPPQTVEVGQCAVWPQDPVMEGFVFKGWYSDTALTVPYDFTQPVTEDITLNARWEGTAGSAHTITIASAQNGTITADKNAAKSGETVTVTATPSDGYKLSSIQVQTRDGSQTAVSGTSFIMPDADVTVTGTFAEDAENRKYTITATGTYATSISLNTVSAKKGETVSASIRNQWQRASASWEVKDAAGNPVPITGNNGWDISFTMPASNVTVSVSVAVAKQYKLTVNGGSGSGTYYEGDEVKIKAGKPAEGKDFSHWACETGNASFADAKNAETTITMPAGDATATACYTAAMRSLTIKNGSGGGTFPVGTAVDISAASPEEGKQFKKWEVESGDAKVKNTEKSVTKVKTGLQNSTVKAVYEDCPGPEGNNIQGIENGRAYAVEQHIEFTATGAGMDDKVLNKGDRRWLPTNYSVNTVSGKWDKAPYKTTMSIRAVGDYTVTVYFSEQVYDGNTWVDTGRTDSKSVSFKISNDPDKENAANGFTTGGMTNTGDGSQDSGGYQVKTGDSSPIMLLTIVMGAAAVAAGILFFVIRKRGKKRSDEKET